MRKLTVIVVASIALIVASAAFGASLYRHTIYNSRGVACQATNGMVACIPSSGVGYGVGISKDGVLVMQVSTNGPGKVVFKRYQP